MLLGELLALWFSAVLFTVGLLSWLEWGARVAGAFAGLLLLQTQARGRLCVGVPEGGPWGLPRARQVDAWTALLRPRASHRGLWGQRPSPEPRGFLQRETEALRKPGWREGGDATRRL